MRKQNYRIRQGDCIGSVAQEHGFFWETLWNNQKNSKLKEDREDPNVLKPGDKLFIPEPEKRTESASTEKCTTFRRKGVPGTLRLRLAFGNEILKNEYFVLEFPGKSIDGSSDSDGILEEFVPTKARTVKISLPDRAISMKLNLGHVDPWDEISGIQARLNNLGFAAGAEDGIMGPKTAGALERFQRRFKLDVTGEPNDATKEKLRDVNDSGGEIFELTS